MFEPGDGAGVNHALQLAHAKALAEADKMKNPFQRILAYRDIAARASDVHALATSSARSEVTSLLKTGTSLAEIVEQTGLSENQVKKLAESQASDVAARA